MATNVAQWTPASSPAEDRDAPAVARLRAAAREAGERGDMDAAGQLLRRAVDLSPNALSLRQELATHLLGAHQIMDAMREADALLALHPTDPGNLFLKAAIAARLGRFDTVIALNAAALSIEPANPHGWAIQAHALKTVGRQPEAVAAYRQALELAPHLGEAWLGLANLKTFTFSDADLVAMRRSLGALGLPPEDHVKIHAALGKALEDAGAYAESFDHYARSNGLRRPGLSYAADETTALVARSKAVLSAPFLSARAGQGCAAPDPIFIVGMPRAGSTLIEQILASHSQIEGTMELPEMMILARECVGGGVHATRDAQYPAVLADLSADALRGLGEAYLDRTRMHRHAGRPFFIDKMPNNWAHLGLIHLILPNAKIIDARRHPLGCGLAIFKQHFANGQSFACDLGEIGRYYADYVELMSHVDQVLPGRVHRVIYEDMVADPEREVRRLLDYCGLPFEAGCLRFYETDRAVRTPSSEQVRRPIYTAATTQWRNFEPWLEPLKTGLGAALEAYPNAPADVAPAARRRARSGAH